MRLVNVTVQQRGPLSNGQIAAVHALAERLGVGIYLQGASTPRDAVFSWNASGGFIRILLFSRALNRMSMR